MKKISARWRNLYTKAGFSSFMASLLAILCGLVVGFVVLLVADPANAFWGLLAILTGGLSDMKNLGQVLYAATPIILTGLSVGFANKTGLFNIGASGQFIVGAYVAVLMGVKCTFIPGPLLWLACLLGAMLAGAVWGLVPGFLKAVCNVNEVIACIMMNYIGMYGVNFLIQLTVFDSLKNQSLPVAENANAPKLGMDLIFRSGATASSANAGIFIAVLAGVVIYYLIEKTKFGYELKATGSNYNAAKYCGMKENQNIILTMVIAGALAGFGAGLLYLTGIEDWETTISSVPAMGFNGIAVAFLGGLSPIGSILSAFFIQYITTGGGNVDLQVYCSQISSLISALIIYLCAFVGFFKYFIQTRLRKADERKAAKAAQIQEGGEDK